jgi:putative hemolysin
MNHLFDALLILLLILLNGLFALSELAIVSARKTRLRALVDRGRRGAASALRLAEEPGRFLSMVQIGITLIGILAGVFSGERLADPLQQWLMGVPKLAAFSGPIAIVLVVAPVAYLSLIIGELVPKRIALRAPEHIAMVVGPVMQLLSRSTAPAVWLLHSSSELVLRLFHLGPHLHEPLTEAEVHAVIAEGVSAGVIEPAEKRLLTGVMHLADWRVRAIMVPRDHIVWLDLAQDEGALRERLATNPYSRLPVARGNLDDLLGILEAKTLAQALVSGKPLDLERLVRPAVYVPTRLSCLRLIETMKGHEVPMLIVRDAYGEVEGLVTADDVLKAIVSGVGEYLTRSEPAVVQRGDGSMLVDGELSIDVLKTFLRIDPLPGEEHFETVAGFVLARMERVPATGEHFDFAGYRIEVVDMDGLRVDKVLISPHETPEGLDL